MGKILVVAEKPSVGRDIARVLGCGGKGDGFLFSDTYIVSWAIGHLVTLSEPEDYDPSLKKWRFDTLPIIPRSIKLKPIENTKKQLGVLKKLMNAKETDSIVCATDSGREGELIFRYIYDIVSCGKPFKRLWISSMTDAAVTDGFKNLKDGSAYDNLYLSAKCRSESDWLVGINSTRAFTLSYNALLSVGRVQTPTLAVLVRRQKEINEFVPKDYFEVKAFFEGYSGVWIDDENETKIFDRAKADAIAEKVNPGTGVVEKVEKEDKKVPPGLLYDLTELQRDCNKKFGLSAQNTLSIAQDLYEKRKLITYPRTDSKYLSSDMVPGLSALLKRLGGVERYADYASYVMALPKLPITKRIVDNSKITDHHAIIPTDVSINTRSLSTDEFKVYDLIVRRFLAAFYPNYIYSVTRLITNVADERFLSKGTTVKKLGWMELYASEPDDNNDDKEEMLPDLKPDDKVTVLDAKVLQKKTQPPKTYTEGTLLSAMENAGRFVEDEDLKEQLKESGLGTPATRAAIIERLLTVGYIERKGKSIIPTEKGMKLIEVVPEELKSPETTGRWEKGLASISKGNMKVERFMQSIERYVHYIVAASQKRDGSVVFAPEDRGRKKN